MTKITSSYTKYLPNILWSPENDSTQFLARMLCIFEQLLTGIPDDKEAFTDCEPLKKAEPLEKAIDKLPDLFNPWRTPTKFLPWLASWLALTLQEDWSEYQKRKFIAQIMSIYQQRGLKQGLLTYLDIYAATAAQPRIVIDDGEAIFRANLTADGAVDLHAVAYSHVVGDVGVLLHPTAIAIDSENNYIVVDQGSQVEPKWKPTLWKISSTGEIKYIGSSPQPIYSGDKLKNPVAVVVDNQNQYYVLVQGESTNREQPTPGIYRFVSNSNTISSNPIPVINPLSAVKPVDMVRLPDTSGNETQSIFYVLDCGDPYDEKKKPKILKVVVKPGSPATVEREQVINLDGEAAELTALAIDFQGRLIIANARKSNSQNPANLIIPADLIRIDPQNNWSVKSLLGQVSPEQNPLIFPTGLVFESSESLLVCDTGLQRDFEPGYKTNRVGAEPTGIYRVDLSQTTPTITLLAGERKLVNPSKIALDQQEQLVVSDCGEFDDTNKREWRARANEFGVVVFFSIQRRTTVEDRNKIRYEIEKVVNEQKPAHTSWSMNPP